MRAEVSPGLPAHLEILSSESDGNLALGAGILDINLKVVDEPLHRSRLVGLNDADVVAVKVDVGVFGGELIGGDDEEAAGAVVGVELRRRVLVLVHVGRAAKRAEARLV